MGPRGEAEPESIDLRKEFDALQFEDLLLELSIRFINLPPDQVDDQVLEAQRRICEFIGVELSALWQWDADDPGNQTLTHLYRPLGGPPVPEKMDAKEFFPWSLGLMAAGEIMVVASPDDAPPEAARDRESWERFGVLSSLCFPLSVGGEPPVGSLSFNTMRAVQSWPDGLVRRLGMLAQVFTNALARKQMDETLRESEARLALAAESAGAGMWSLDLVAGRFWLTPKTLELIGLPPDESVTLDSFLKMVHPDDHEPIRRTIREITDTGGERHVEYRLLRPDGSVSWLASRGRTARDPHAPEGPARIMGVTVDVSERKRLEEVTRSLTGRIIAAHEEERARLARELHDDITQRVACMAVEVSRIEGLTDAPSSAESLRTLREDLARMSRDVHALSYRLHPTILTELGLAEAVRAECERFGRQQEIAVDLALDGIPDSLPRDASLCLFRVAQAALHNVARHAGASRIELSIRERDGGLRLEVGDDGQGFDASVAPEFPTLGLSGMRERVRHLGGRFDVRSAPGQGTSVLTWLPLARRSQ